MDRRNHVSGQTGVTGSNPVLTTNIIEGSVKCSQGALDN
jgi:hypothetical protein